ncbi:DUF3429 domain-containing protein [Shewanella sp. SR43-4]|jgi:hypothetical protein|uniref:DUF3429 domain-containing protein n=1 Tax=Shewanella TaxID=22 RepID=UPI000F50CB30|nr:MULTISPECIES: DUF3429 domain-containing protein [Shewanella]MBB1319141.1 DUF3429 domain-containing protein [Shewanella sp. SR43-4]MBB1323008.1 DUF3429 domain-containing protein [Shewanella sp. SR43-8]MBB1391304.1 DUF3429 domain-containing protein [Shewanella sp. SG44-6]MBB1475679.1 DUF3429 domain-containing protein [Shewanella sp. SG41-3]RPA46397.1 DUF3429 domain-containing protein [Shewanella vesiculosa]|tara:strand:+ start:4887 stop:5327 length:441 start_codon:yes stop_codon:yes gene_type:complete
MNSIKTWQWLGFAGLLPFIILSVLAFNHSLLAPEMTMLGFVSYSAVILSFVAGTLWGKAVILTLDDNIAKLLIISNIIALGCWIALLTPFVLSALILLVSGYLYLLYVEFKAKQLSTTTSYITLRTILTSVAVVCHIVVMLSLFSV